MFLTQKEILTWMNVKIGNNNFISMLLQGIDGFPQYDSLAESMKMNSNDSKKTLEFPFLDCIDIQISH